MIHQVTTKRRTYWQDAPLVGLLVLALLLMLQVPAPLRPMPVQQALVESVARAIHTTQTTELLARPDVRLFVPVDRTRTSSRRTWMTVTGVEVAEVQVFERPTTDLPRSSFGDARWSPITDKIEFKPFKTPTIGYFVGSVIAAGSKGAFNTAVSSTAVDQDIVEIDMSPTWTRGGGAGGVGSAANARFRDRGTTGYVLIRDASTYVGLPSPDARVQTSHFTGKNVQSVDASDSMWDFSNASRGWYIQGLHIQNQKSGTSDNARLLYVGATDGSFNYTTNIANSIRYLIFEHNWIENPWESTYTFRTRGGLSPDCEYAIIRGNQISGICSVNNENKGINCSSAIGKFQVTNNAIEASTENIMWGGALVRGDLTTVSGDIYTARNYFYRRPEWMVSSVGFAYTNSKNFMEHKQGLRHVWERNECWGHTGQGQQQNLQIKHAGQGNSDKGRVVCQNVLFRYNRMENSAALVSVATSTNSFYTANGTNRIEVYGNLEWNQHVPFRTNTANRLIFSDLNGTDKIVSDIYIHNNTYRTFYTCLAIGGTQTSNAGSLPRLKFINNVDFGPTHSFTAPLANAGYAGTALLNSACGAGNWTFAGNVAIGAAGFPWNNVAGNYAVAASALQFVDESTGNYKLVDYSAYTGTDGQAPGVPYDHMVSMLSGVLAGDAA